jgi:hypothetical protein
MGSNNETLLLYLVLVNAWPKYDVALQYRFIGVYSMWRLYIICDLNLMDYGFRACRMNVVWVVVVLVYINVG